MLSTKNINVDQLPLVFIIASPRTGSTLLYQVLINVYGFSYFSNFVNNIFHYYPLLGIKLENLIFKRNKLIKYESKYGKMRGFNDPSEASYLFRKWFGGEHPSQIKSSQIRVDEKEDFTYTLIEAYKITKKVLLVKNAWNCFRVNSLSTIFPKTLFIWLRRDIIDSALSDLQARVKRGSVYTWNSATTYNYREIQQKEYWEQVVEQQYEYNKSIKADLMMYCPDNFCEIWYEDLCLSTRQTISKLNIFFEKHSTPIDYKPDNIPNLKISKSLSTISDEHKKISDYIEKDISRFSEYIYKGKKND